MQILLHFGMFEIHRRDREYKNWEVKINLRKGRPSLLHVCQLYKITLGGTILNTTAQNEMNQLSGTNCLLFAK